MVKDKADQERNIEEIKAEHEKEKKGIEEVHEKKIKHLQNRISELECKEKAAQIVLEKVKVELTNALLEKEKALSQLREKFHIEEKAKMELEILLEKEKTQRAQEATEHAEERERTARDEAQRAKDESKHTKVMLDDLWKRHVDYQCANQETRGGPGS